MSKNKILTKIAGVNIGHNNLEGDPNEILEVFVSWNSKTGATLLNPPLNFKEKPYPDAQCMVHLPTCFPLN